MSNPIIDKMKNPQIQPIGKVIRKDIRIFNLSPDSIREVTGEIPFNIAVYESMRGKHKEESIPQEDDDHKIISLLDKKKPVEEDKVIDPFEVYEEEIIEKKNEDRLFFEIPLEKYSTFMNKLMKLLTPKLNSMINSATGETDNLSSDFIELEMLEPKPYKIKPGNIHKFLTSED